MCDKLGDTEQLGFDEDLDEELPIPTENTYYSRSMQQCINDKLTKKNNCTSFAARI